MIVGNPEIRLSCMLIYTPHSSLLILPDFGASLLFLNCSAPKLATQSLQGSTKHGSWIENDVWRLCEISRLPVQRKWQFRDCQEMSNSVVHGKSVTESEHTSQPHAHSWQSQITQLSSEPVLNKQDLRLKFSTTFQCYLIGPWNAKPEVTWLGSINLYSSLDGASEVQD